MAQSSVPDNHLSTTLGDRLGVRGLIDEHVTLGKVTGSAYPGQKTMTVVAAMVKQLHWGGAWSSSPDKMI